MFRARPPMYDSSISIPPSNLSNDSLCIARRIRCRTCHADFWVIPTARLSACELRPFLLLLISQIQTSHLSSGIAESSKIEPSLTENCFLHPLHFQTRRVVRYE